MLIGTIADDFTGASDIANTFARRGLATTLFVGAPDGAYDGCEAGVVALKSRSCAANEAIALSLKALDFLQEAGAQQIVFKYCSTFDSTPEGNIGPVADALIDRLKAQTAIVCPAFPTNARTIYRGHLFVGDKLLNESGMENHPLNPMSDANLARWLSRQSQNRVGMLPLDIVRKGAGAVRVALDEAARRGEALVICDATSDEDLFALGAAAKGMALVTGGSGIALGLPDNFERQVNKQSVPLVAPKGRAVALSGSCSRATEGQVRQHLMSQPGMRLDVEAVLAGRYTVSDALNWLDAQKAARLPLIYSTAEPAAVKALQACFGAAEVAEAVEGFFARLAQALAKSGTTRLITAGGETSSAVVSALSLVALAIGPEIDPGVPVLVSREAGLALALKSGNFGAPDFFLKALGVMDSM